MDIEKIIKEFRESLKEIYDGNLAKLILYGSYARGDFNSDSDIDLLVVLNEAEKPGKEIDRMIEIVNNINLKYNVLISVLPISITDFESLNSPLLLNVRREGVEQ